MSIDIDIVDISTHACERAHTRINSWIQSYMPTCAYIHAYLHARKSLNKTKFIRTACFCVFGRGTICEPTEAACSGCHMASPCGRSGLLRFHLVDSLNVDLKIVSFLFSFFVCFLFCLVLFLFIFFIFYFFLFFSFGKKIHSPGFQSLVLFRQLPTRRGRNPREIRQAPAPGPGGRGAAAAGLWAQRAGAWAEVLVPVALKWGSQKHVCGFFGWKWVGFFVVREKYVLGRVPFKLSSGAFEYGTCMGPVSLTLRSTSKMHGFLHKALRVHTCIQIWTRRKQQFLFLQHYTCKTSALYSCIG